MRVLLISSNVCDQPYPVFPLGLAHLDAALRAAGHTTRVHDCTADTQVLEEVLRGFGPEVVGVSCRNIDDIQYTRRQTFFDAPTTVVTAVRRVTRCPVVLGGSAFSLYPEPLLARSGADYGIHGEGELAFVQLLTALESGADVADVPGLVYQRAGRWITNPRQPMDGRAMTAAGRRPELAAWYVQHSSMLNVQTQRGCGFRCCYCSYPLIEGRHPRRRDPAAVAEELAEIERLGARHVFIADSVFNTGNDHVQAVCEAILHRGVRLKWSCFLRPQGLTAELMQLMARAGLTHIEFGADSFCDAVLAEYGKSFSFEEIRQVSHLARAHKVHYAHFLICGGPGETRATLEETFAKSQSLPGAVIFGLVGMRIFPGTPLADRARREGRISAAQDLLEPVYYLSSALTEAELLGLLEGFKTRATNWIVGDLPPNWPEFSRKLRERGVTGPLWEYFRTLRMVG